MGSFVYIKLARLTIFRVQRYDGFNHAKELFHATYRLNWVHVLTHGLLNSDATATDGHGYPKIANPASHGDSNGHGYAHTAANRDAHHHAYSGLSA